MGDFQPSFNPRRQREDNNKPIIYYRENLTYRFLSPTLYFDAKFQEIFLQKRISRLYLDKSQRKIYPFNVAQS